MESIPKLDEGFEEGIRYEVLRESLGNEMARHNSAAHTAGLESDAGLRHREAMLALSEVRRRLRPDDTNLLEVVALLLKSGESDRTASAA